MSLFDVEPDELPEQLVPDPPEQPRRDDVDELVDARLDGLLDDEPDVELCPCGSPINDGRHRIAEADALMRRLGLANQPPQEDQPQ